MVKILKFNKYNFLKENYGSEFNQYQFGNSPGGLGPGYGFAVDAGISIYASQDSPYTNPYYATANQINNLMYVMKNVYQSMGSNRDIRFDYFLDDIDKYTDLRILKINKNENLTLDIFIAFNFNDEEFFGVIRNYNAIQRVKLISDLFTDGRCRYMDAEYRLKLDTFFYKILNSWFNPVKTNYKSLKDVEVRNDMGQTIKIPNNAIVEVVAVNKDKDGNKFIRIKHKDKIYVINKNNYYFFNYWFEKL